MRRWLIALGSVAAGLMLLGVATAAMVEPYLLPSGFRAASYFPRDTWMFGTVTLRPGLSQFMSGRTLADAFTGQPGFEAAVRAAQTSSFFGSSVDWEKEVVPLLDGEIALGVFGALAKPEAIVMAHSSDPAKLLRVLAASNKLPELRERYKDALYFETRESGMVAASRGWVVAGTTRSTVEETIDRLESGSNDVLSATDRFSSVVNRLPDERLGFMFFDTQPIMTAPEMRKSLAQLGPEFREYLERNAGTGRVALALSAANDGLDMKLEGILDQPPPGGSEFPKGSVLVAFERLPADTLFAFGDESLPVILSKFEKAAGSTMREALGSQAPQLDFQFSRWMGGEFALGVSRGSLRLDARGRQQGTPDLFLVAKVRDVSAANTDLAAFDGLLMAKPATVSGISMKQIVGGPDASAYYGVADDWMYLLWGQPEKVLGARAANSAGLSMNDRFGMVRRAISSDGSAMFVDLEGSRRAMEDLMTPPQRESYDRNRVFIQPLKAFGGSSRTDANGDIHGQWVLAIHK